MYGSIVVTLVGTEWYFSTKVRTHDCMGLIASLKSFDYGNVRAKMA